MIEAAYGAALMDLIADAAVRAWRLGVTEYECEVTHDELVSLMAAGGPERLVFTRDVRAQLAVPAGVVHLTSVLGMRPAGRFVVTARKSLASRAITNMGKPDRAECSRGCGKGTAVGTNGKGLGDIFQCPRCGSRWSDTSR